VPFGTATIFPDSLRLPAPLPHSSRSPAALRPPFHDVVNAKLRRQHDCLDIGADLNSPISLDSFDQAPFAFNGAIREAWVKYSRRDTPSRAPLSERV